MQELLEQGLPSVAMTYDGTTLENLIEGYRTITVSGRETSDVVYEGDNVKFGTIITKQRIAYRPLAVKFMLKASTNEAFQEKFKQLMAVLYRKKDVAITFADDPDTHFYGRYSKFETVPVDRNQIITSFEIYCQDPLKYGPTIETNGEVTINTIYETAPEEILVTPSSTIDHLEITNGTYTIRLDGNIALGNEVKILFKEQEIYVNGIISTYMFALNSDFENFQIQQGETITSSNGSLILKARERWL